MTGKPKRCTNGFPRTRPRTVAPGNGDGATVGDIRGFDPGTSDSAGQLRAERAGTGRGRVYTLTYVGRDAAGNQRACTATVSVPHACSGAHAAKAARQVKKARREYAARLRGGRSDA